jgi:hypothetical protein
VFQTTTTALGAASCNDDAQQFPVPAHVDRSVVVVPHRGSGLRLAQSAGAMMSLKKKKRWRAE